MLPTLQGQLILATFQIQITFMSFVKKHKLKFN